jgi:hypothetical protein
MELLPGEYVEKPISFDMLAFNAPYLIERLLNNAIVGDIEEGEQLFMELKRWMFLVNHDTSKKWEMYSYRIDEVWHQFILFTDEYIKFSDHYLGSYISHFPGNAPGYNKADQSLIGSFEDFKQLYERTFAIKLPDLWFDEKSIRLNRRLLNDAAGKLFLEEGNEMIKMINANGNNILSINTIARDAVAFIAATKAFYVRELPGDLTDGEKIQLISSLVKFKILRVAS